VGSIAGATAFPMVLPNPVGGVNAAAATIFIAGLFLFSLGKAFWFIRHRNAALHREWMIRAVAIVLGIATTRPIMGAFFANHVPNPSHAATVLWHGVLARLQHQLCLRRGLAQHPRGDPSDIDWGKQVSHRPELLWSCTINQPSGDLRKTRVNKPCGFFPSAVARWY